MKPPTDNPRPQADKFAYLARKLECDENEEAFDERMKKVAKARPPGAWKVVESKDGRYYGRLTPSNYAAVEHGPDFPTEHEAQDWVAEQKRLARG